MRDSGQAIHGAESAAHLLVRNVPTLFPDMSCAGALAVVLAGGRGSRLGPLTRRRAKPTVPFGGRFRIIDFPLSNCVNSGIRRIAIVTQYMAQSLLRHTQESWNFLDARVSEFVEAMPAQQRSGDGWYLGTADAVFQNLDLLQEHRPRLVVILAGDHVYRMDYAQFVADHVESGADVSIVSGGTVRGSLLSTGVHVHSYCEIDDSVLMPEVTVGRHTRLRRVIVDRRVKIPAGVDIGFDSEADRTRFHVSPGGITVVTQSMIDAFVTAGA